MKGEWQESVDDRDRWPRTLMHVAWSKAPLKILPKENDHLAVTNDIARTGWGLHSVGALSHSSNLGRKGMATYLFPTEGNGATRRLNIQKKKEKKKKMYDYTEAIVSESILKGWIKRGTLASLYIPLGCRRNKPWTQDISGHGSPFWDQGSSCSP